MEEIYSEKGVFIHSENLQSKFLIECLQSLIAIWPDMKIIQVISDAVINGYKLYFEDLDVKTVLDKRYITVEDRQIFIYPLTTFLVIQNVYLNDDGSLIRDIGNVIEDKFGKVLYSKQLARTSNHTMETSTDYFLIQIDIPEIRDLVVFQKNGYPQFFKVPSMNKSFRMEFWCRNCKNQYHIYQECFENSVKSNGSSREKSMLPAQLNPSIIDMHCKAYTNVKQVFCDSASSFLESTESFAPKVGRELAMKVGLSDENYTSNLGNVMDESKNFVSPVKYPRKEVTNQALYEKNTSSVKSNEMFNRNELCSSTSDGNSLTGNELIFPREIKKEVDDISFTFSKGSISTVVKNDEDTKPLNSNFPRVSDDDIQILEDDASIDNILLQDSYSENASSEVDIVERNSPISVPREEHSSLNFTNLSYKSTPRNSSRPRIRSSTPKQQIETTRVLSDRLQNCINDSCNVLDRKTLNAFLTHVKKKSNPIRVAANYTSNVQGLKEQLQKILSLYYNTPQTGTKEDIAFIKWLNGLVERFDGTIPRKRKPAKKQESGIINFRIA